MSDIHVPLWNISYEVVNFELSSTFSGLPKGWELDYTPEGVAYFIE